MMKINVMVQWMNLHQNNNFVNRIRLSLLCEKPGAVASASGSYGRQADKTQNF